MAKGKPLTQLVPDFREALEEGVQQATETVVRELQIAGPYWTGFFSDVWQVNVGKTAVKANIKNPLEVPKQPKVPNYVDIDVPDSPRLQGYTIGNRAEYRVYAMDLKPTTRGRKGGNAPNATAEPNWFDTYFNAQMPSTIEQQLTNVFRRYTK